MKNQSLSKDLIYQRKLKAYKQEEVAGKGIRIMANSDNGESAFKELLEVAIGDIYTPWEWQNYIPYNHQE